MALHVAMLSALVVASVLLHSLLVVTQKLSANENGSYKYSFIMLSTVSEAIKWLVSVAVFKVQLWRGTALRQDVTWKESLKWSVPAICYVFTNNISFVIMEMLHSPVVLQVFSSLEIVVVAVFSVVMLKKRISVVQWLAVLLVASSVMSSELALCKDCEEPGKFPILAVLLTLVQCSVAAFASVFIEKQLKNDGQGIKYSIFQQNSHLYLYGMFANMLLLTLADRDALLNPQDHIWDTTAFVLLFLFVVLGLVTAAIMKHLSNIVKMLSANASLTLTLFLSWLWFGQQVTILAVICLFNLCLGIGLYKTSSPSIIDDAQLVESTNDDTEEKEELIKEDV